MINLIFIFLLAYILGSLPFGFWITKLVRGIDIRKFGSGNIGATNVARVMGKSWGILVFFLDFLKGFLAVVISFLLLPQSSFWVYLIAGILAVSGHNWSPFLKFKGGKGVSTTLGVISGLVVKYNSLFFPLIISIISWILIFLIFRIVSLASLSSAFLFFLSTLFFKLPSEIKIFSFLLFLFIVLRHKSNIVKLLKKKEFRF